MGLEKICRITINGNKFEAKVLLESESIIIRGEEKRIISFQKKM